MEDGERIERRDIERREEGERANREERDSEKGGMRASEYWGVSTCDASNDRDCIELGGRWRSDQHECQ